MLLDLTVHWIAAEILTKELQQSMPDTGPPNREATAAAESSLDSPA